MDAFRWGGVVDDELVAIAPDYCFGTNGHHAACFCFALPARALADIVNRRTLLLWSNILMFGAAGVFAYMVYLEAVTAWTLLLFTFLLGAGAAFMAPAWQAVVPRMVPKEDLPAAVALGGISINLSRAIGPALAGLLISLYGLTSPFIANAASFIVIILALMWWRYEAPKSTHDLPPEHMVSAMKVGLRFAKNSGPLRATMWHVMGFMFFGNAFWGLMPIISREQLAGDATFYGLMMGAIGFGAVGAAFFLPKLKAKFNANQLVAMGTVGTSAVTAFFAFATDQNLALVASLIFGISWIFVLASVNVSAQQALPEWVRARGLAVFLMVFFGAMSVGATFWGWLAGVTSIQTAMIAAGIGGVAFIGVSFGSKLQQGKDLNLTPSHHWPEPAVHDEVEPDAGPVVVQIRYQVDEADRDDFIAAIHKLKPSRIRDGAV